MLWFLARAVQWEEAGLFRRPPQYFPRHYLTLFVMLNPEAGILCSESNVIVEPLYIGTKRMLSNATQ